MAELIRPKIQRLAANEDESYGKFLIEPLERGFGTTLGNALRRILLSFVQGLAVVSVRIEGVVHEFSTLPGVYEDSMEILLNLKQLCFRPTLHNGFYEVPDGERWRVRVEASGECEVTAADLQVPPEIEVVRPETHIATLTSPDARLEMELEIAAGRGYVSAEQHEKGNIVGVIPVDSIFTPVVNATFHVEPTRVGHKINFERLVFEVWTKSTVRASHAISSAAQILDQYLRFFFDFKDEEEETAWAEARGQRLHSKVLDYRIEDLDFSVRTYNCLKKEGLNTVGDLVEKGEQDLLGIRNFGKKSLVEVQQKLNQWGLNLKQVPELGEDLDLGDEDIDLALDETG